MAQAEETLETVLAEIYNADLSLAAARWRLQATNQGVSVAEQRGRASASIRSSFTRSYSKWSQKQQARENGEIPSSKGTDITLPREGSIGFTQPIVIGKTLEYLVDAAEAQVYAARERYSASEQQVLLGGVSAYMALWRDQALLEIESEAEEISKGELEIVKRRALLGEATRTDVILGEAPPCLCLSRAACRHCRTGKFRVGSCPPVGAHTRQNLHPAVSACPR